MNPKSSKKPAPEVIDVIVEDSQSALSSALSPEELLLDETKEKEDQPGKEGHSEPEATEYCLNDPYSNHDPQPVLSRGSPLSLSFQRRRTATFSRIPAIRDTRGCGKAYLGQSSRMCGYSL